MDILSQYKQDHPEGLRKKNSPQPTDEYGREYSGMFRLVMRLSGGRIKDTRQANYALLLIAGIIAVVAIYLSISAIGGEGAKPLPYEATYKPVK